MEPYLSLIKKSPLFCGITEADVLPLLEHLKAVSYTHLTLPTKLEV